MIDPTALLKSRDPATNPRPGDAVAIESAQYTVVSIEEPKLVYELLHKGRRYTYATTVKAWTDKMRGAVVVSVSNDVARAKR